MSMKKISMDKLKPLTESEIVYINKFPETYDDPECKPLSKSQLQDLKPLRLIHPEWFRVKKSDVHMKIDSDILAVLKSQGKGYQTRINDILRKAVESGEY